MSCLSQLRIAEQKIAGAFAFAVRQKHVLPFATF